MEEPQRTRTKRTSNTEADVGYMEANGGAWRLYWGVHGGYHGGYRRLTGVKLIKKRGWDALDCDHRSVELGGACECARETKVAAGWQRGYMMAEGLYDGRGVI